MTWSISVSGQSKDAAKLAATKQLGNNMLCQADHARDFPIALAAIHGAIDQLAEGHVSVSASGYLNGGYAGEPPVAVSLSVHVSSLPNPVTVS